MDQPWGRSSKELIASQVERNLLFQYLPELRAYRSNSADSCAHNREILEAFDLLIRTVKKGYEDITQRLNPLFREGKITYDLLWTLFSVNDSAPHKCLPGRASGVGLAVWAAPTSCPSGRAVRPVTGPAKPDAVVHRYAVNRN